jgi:hypothetical protein
MEAAKTVVGFLGAPLERAHLQLSVRVFIAKLATLCHPVASVLAAQRLDEDAARGKPLLSRIVAKDPPATRRRDVLGHDDVLVPTDGHLPFLGGGERTDRLSLEVDGHLLCDPSCMAAWDPLRVFVGKDVLVRAFERTLPTTKPSGTRHLKKRKSESAFFFHL